MEIFADSLLSRSLWELQNTNVILIGLLRKHIDRNLLEVRGFESPSLKKGNED